MKAIIITLALAAGLVSMNINNASASNKKSIYNKVEMNATENSKTTTYCDGVNDMNLKLTNKSIMKYDDNGCPMERITYKWDVENEKWVALKKYGYIYNADKTLEAMSLTRWDASTRSWKNESVTAMYLYGTNGEFLSVVK